MKANELRIGNWIIEDETIYSYGISKIKRQISLNDFRVSDDNWSDLWDMFKPIPLTEEWLFKFGFELINNNFYRSRNCELCLHWTVNKNKMVPEYYGKRLVTGYDFKYVHQLQNLYFALTNEELIVNL